VAIINARAPNFMGTSNHDLMEYTMYQGKEVTKTVLESFGGTYPDNSFTLDENKYRQTMREIARKMCQIAKENGKTTLVIPEFGVGIYVKLLTPESKDAAKRIMAQEFNEAAKNSNINVKLIVFGVNKDKEILDYKKYVGVGSKVDVVNGDIFDEMHKQGSDACAFANPGSDRTIGGDRERPDPHTLEEKMAQSGTLVQVTSKVNLQASKVTVEAYKKHAKENSDKVREIFVKFTEDDILKLRRSTKPLSKQLGEFIQQVNEDKQAVVPPVTVVMKLIANVLIEASEKEQNKSALSKFSAIAASKLTHKEVGSEVIRIILEKLPKEATEMLIRDYKTVVSSAADVQRGARVSSNAGLPGGPG
jgi:hypothetical protein